MYVKDTVAKYCRDTAILFILRPLGDAQAKGASLPFRSTLPFETIYAFFHHGSVAHISSGMNAAHTYFSYSIRVPCMIFSSSN